MNYFVTAINTDSGKTLASAIITEALNADYWKPIQAGKPTDSDTIKSLISEPERVHQESFFLKTPASPHFAAAVENINIRLDDIQLPKTENDLVIEGAGGMLVPINDEEYVIDFATKFQCKVILVSNLYLGSINHTLLSLEALKHRNLEPVGIIFNGESNPSSEEIILKKYNIPVLLRIHKEKHISPAVVTKYAYILKQKLNELDF